MFKDNFSNQNLYHIFKLVSKCSKQLTPPEVESSTSGYFKNKFEIINFQCFESSLLLKGFTWILYMLLTLEMSKKKKKKKKEKKMSLSVMRYGVEEFKNCFSIFSEAVKDRVLIFSGMTDLSFRVVNRGFRRSAVISSRHRKGKKKSKFSKLIFQIKTYTTLDLFWSVQNNRPHRKLKRQQPAFFKNKFQILNFQCLMYSLLPNSYTWNWYICCWH